MFGFKKKTRPSIKTEWYIVVYDRKQNRWSLEYKGVEFTYAQANIDLPKIETLDLYLSWVSSYKGHIEENVTSMCKGWDDVFVDPTKWHLAFIEVESPNRIAAMILGDDTWGDMGYDIWLENGVIKNEGFGD
jgi:hypothetical protein